MAKKIAPLLPPTTELLQRFGERLRLARLRRRLTAKQVGERAGMAPMTLRSLEHGGAGVTIGAYLAVMQVLGIEKDLNLLGAVDPLGRELQDARLTAQGNPAVRTVPPTSAAPVKHRPMDAAMPASRPSRKGTEQWVEESGFTSAQALLDLIDTRDTAPKERR